MSKDLEYYRSIHYKMVWEYDKDDEVYFVRFPELPGCLAHGETEQEALKTALKVKDEWLEATYAAGWEIPEPFTAPETTGRITTRLPKYLHQKVIDRAEAEGVSLNQLILAFIAQGLERTSAEESFNKIAAMQEHTLKLLSDIMQISGNEQGLMGSLYPISLHTLAGAEPFPVVCGQRNPLCASNIVVGIKGETAAMASNLVSGSEGEEMKQYTQPQLRSVDEASYAIQ